MRTCPTCGGPVTNELFCPHCGTPLSQPSVPAEPPAPTWPSRRTPFTTSGRLWQVAIWASTAVTVIMTGVVTGIAHSRLYPELDSLTTLIYVLRLAVIAGLGVAALGVAGRGRRGEPLPWIVLAVAVVVEIAGRAFFSNRMTSERFFLADVYSVVVMKPVDLDRGIIIAIWVAIFALWMLTIVVGQRVRAAMAWWPPLAIAVWVVLVDVSTERLLERTLIFEYGPMIVTAVSSVVQIILVTAAMSVLIAIIGKYSGTARGSRPQALPAPWMQPG